MLLKTPSYGFKTFLNCHFFYNATTPTKATRQNSPQIQQIKITEVNNHFTKNIPVIKLYITKVKDLWSLWIICWKTIINHPDFYSINLKKILSDGLGQSSRTVTPWQTKDENSLKRYAGTRIRTWFTAATTQSPNHQTIAAYHSTDGCRQTESFLSYFNRSSQDFIVRAILASQNAK